MKISLEWLTDFLPGPLDASDAADALTGGGLPVELIEKHGDDTVIDVEVTSNRADCLSHLGVARELSALLHRPLVQIAPVAAACTESAESRIAVSIQAPNLCPHYTARVIRGVKVGPSPRWLARRLEVIGLRSINNIVDVTNYVMFELGQPLHAFDLDRVGGASIIVRNAMPGETLRSIDGHDRRLTSDMLVIADAAQPLALAGVMGGQSSEVNPQTVNILLESARFDPLSVRSTARRLGMKSDSSYRFERGIDPTLPQRASLRAAQLILETAGGELLCDVAQAGSGAALQRRITLRIERLEKLLGVRIPAAEAVNALERLHLAPQLHGETIVVEAPSWRADLNLEVDLIEEVARIAGYDKIPTQERISIRLAPPQPQLKTIDQIRGTVIAGGYFESISVTFVSDSLAAAFTPAGVTLPRTDPMVRKADARLRPSLIPGLLEGLRRNETAGNGPVRLFEIGSAFGEASATAVDEKRKLGLAGSENLREVRGLIELLLHRLDPTRDLRITPADAPGFADGAAGKIVWGGDSLGFIGRISKAVCDALDLRHHPIAAELELSPLLAGAQHLPQLAPLPKYPATRRDLSLILPDHVRFAAIADLIREVAPADLEEVQYVGVYHGKPLASGTKSQTVSLVFRSPNETLTSAAVDASMKAVIEAAGKQGFALRE